ncbi:MAG: alpha/beta fold hydrolase [Hyphomicrobiales bacterium]
MFDRRFALAALAAIPLALDALLPIHPPLARARSGATAEPDSLRVLDTGEGIPVVLIPGIAGGAFGFRAVADSLQRAGYRVLTVEPLGMGGSSRPKRADYSLAAQGDRIAAALDGRDVGDAVLVGHSVGAAIAMRIALRRPDLVRAVVAIEGGAQEAAATPGLRRAMKFAKVIKIFGSAGGLRKRIRNQLIQSSADASWVTDVLVDEYAGPVTADWRRSIDVLAGMARSREPDSLAPHLTEVECPVEIVIGEVPHSGAVPAEELARLVARIPRVAVTRVPGAGHFIQEERPGAVVAAVERASDRITTDAPDGAMNMCVHMAPTSPAP